MADLFRYHTVVPLMVHQFVGLAQEGVKRLAVPAYTKMTRHR